MWKTRGCVCGAASIFSWLLAEPSGAAAAGPDPDCGHARICGLHGPEDLVSILHGTGVIASRLAGGGFDFIDTRTRGASQIDPAAMPQLPDPIYPCTQLKSDQFISQGLSKKSSSDGRERLYVVRHGAREAIEIFRFAAGEDVHSLQWIGCVPLPEGFDGNAVAGRTDGGFYVTSMTDAGSQSLASKLSKLSAVRPSGAVLQWRPEAGFRQIWTGPISGPNGIELSSDERWLYVAGWANGAIWAISLRDTSLAPRALRVGFLPDNLRWAEDGSLVAAGVRADPKATIDCAYTEEAKTPCATSWSVVRIDATRMRIQVEYRSDDRSRFGDLSVALPVGHELWLGSFSGETVAVEKDRPVFVSAAP